MLILSLDATTSHQSVAVARDGDVLAELRLFARAGTSRRVLPAVDNLLRLVEIAPGDVEGFAVTIGPGSFTGVRVALATVQGLALASNRRVLGISSLDVLACRAAGESDVVVPIIDSERGEVYAALYDRAGRPMEAPRNWPLDELLNRVPAGAAFVGDGARVHRDRLAAACPGARFSPRSSFLAATLAVMAGEPLAAGEGVHPRELRPLYLRGAHIRGQP